MNEFNKSNLRQLRMDIDKALEGVTKKHKIAIKLGSITYDSNSFRTKLEALIVDGSLSGMNKAHITPFNNLKKYGYRYSLTEGDYGKTFKYAGREYKFIGVMPRSTRYPFVVERDGRSYKLPELPLKTMFNK